MRTIKELADEIGKSKTTISQRIDELGLRTTLQKVSNKFLIPDDTAEQIISSFTNEPQTTSQTEVQPVDTEIRNEYIEFLKSELAAKNDQISRQNDQISQLQQLLHQEQQLRLVADQKILMLESKQPETEIDTESESAEPEQPKKKWWHFWK